MCSLAASLTSLPGSSLYASNTVHDVMTIGLEVTKVDKPNDVLSEDTFHEGDMLLIGCQYKFRETYCIKESSKWLIGFYVNGQKITSLYGSWPKWYRTLSSSPQEEEAGFHRASTCEFKRKEFTTRAKWKARRGKHTLKCVLNESGTMTESNRGNNSVETKIKVRRAEK